MGSTGSMGSMSSFGGGGDANGMERLAGETDQQYIARQTRLRDEARARMAAKFGGSGMGGVGSSRVGGMSGIGSDPNYNPHGGYGGGGIGVDSVVSGIGNAFNFAASIVTDDRTKQSITGFTSSVTSTAKTAGAGFWSGLTSSVQNAAQAVGQPGDDGLADLQREFQAKASTSNNKYGGFGSDGPRSFGAAPSGGMGGSSEAPGLPGEDRNGVGRLTGETDQQYIARQTRLKEEAKARMAAKFGNGGLGASSGVSSSGFGQGMSQPSSGMSGGTGEAPGLPGEDRNGVERLTGESDDQYIARQTRLREEAKARMAAKFGNSGGLGGVGSASAPSSSRGIGSAPASGNSMGSFGTPQRSFTPPSNSFGTQQKTPPKKEINSNDFFASFGT